MNTIQIKEKRPSEIIKMFWREVLDIDPRDEVFASEMLALD